MTNVPPNSPPLLNPYYAKAMIQEPEMFFGRTELLRHLYEAVFHRQSVSIVGPRSIGKSSLLWCACMEIVQDQFSFELQRHLFVFLDLRGGYLRKTHEDFFHDVCKAIIAEGKKRDIVLYSEGKGEDEFSNILDQLKELGFFPVLLLDAFDKVTLNEHFDPEFFEFLRAHASMGLVAYVTASIAPLYEVCHSSITGSPFFNIFYQYQIGALLPEEARELITAPMKQHGMSPTEAEVDLVLKLAGRHPYFIQRVCYLLWNEKSKQGTSEIDRQLLKKRAYEELTDVFKDTWEQLSQEKRRQLLDEIQRRENQQRNLPEISESELFRQFIRKTCQGDKFQLSFEDLEEALDTISDVKALGETSLHQMRIVSQRLQSKTFPSVIEKGMVIRDILREAFERLRPTSSVRSNTAPEWRFFNILDYRYFTYNLTNAKIANLINFSVRQYYREREKAIEALFNVLVEMEQRSVASS